MIERVNHVWADITYIPIGRGFLYLVAIIDWASRAILAWRLSNTMDVSFCVAALGDALAKYRQPDKITIIFGRKVTKHYRGKLRTEIEDMNLPNPVIRSHYGNGFIKQYVRDHLILRTEPTSNHVEDYGVRKAIKNLPQLRKNMSAINDNYISQCAAGYP